MTDNHDKAPRDSGFAAGDRDKSPERKSEEKLLDQTLEATFPASDPSSVTRAPKEKRETSTPPDSPADRKTPRN